MGILANPINELREGFNSFVNTIGEIINFLNPWHEKFFLKVAFIPSEGYFEEYVADIKTIFDTKFIFISDVRDFLGNIFGAVINTNPDPPEFKINLPGGKWGQGSVKIIDFSLFAQYRMFVINFIRVILWIPFLLKLYRRMPSLVYQ